MNATCAHHDVFECRPCSLPSDDDLVDAMARAAIVGGTLYPRTPEEMRVAMRAALNVVRTAA
jgi:hypothetical protein